MKLLSICARFLSRHAHKQHRRTVKSVARQMRGELGLPPLKALK